MILKFYNLHKLEFANMANGVIEILKKYDLKALNIEVIATRLLNKQPDVDELIVWYNENPFSDDIGKLRKERSKYLIAVNALLKSKEIVEIGSQKEFLKLVSPVIRHHLNGLSASNDKVVTESIGKFFEAVDANASLKEALAALGFDEYLTKLKSIQEEIDLLCKKRVTSFSERTKMRTVEIKQSVVREMENLFQRIKLAKLENPDLDYDSLSNELNAWLAPYQSLMKNRDKRFKKKELFKTEEEDKKTVALSGKTTATA